MGVEDVALAEIHRLTDGDHDRWVQVARYTGRADAEGDALALTEFEAVDSEVKAKKNVRAAIEAVSARLGNTPTICRKCYVHPEVLNCYMDGSLLLDIRQEIEEELGENLASLRPEEAAVMALLHERLSRDAEAGSERARGRAKEAA